MAVDSLVLAEVVGRMVELILALGLLPYPILHRVMSRIQCWELPSARQTEWKPRATARRVVRGEQQTDSQEPECILRDILLIGDGSATSGGGLRNTVRHRNAREARRKTFEGRRRLFIIAARRYKSST